MEVKDAADVELYERAVKCYKVATRHSHRDMSQRRAARLSLPAGSQDFMAHARLQKACETYRASLSAPPPDWTAQLAVSERPLQWSTTPTAPSETARALRILQKGKERADSPPCRFVRDGAPFAALPYADLAYPSGLANSRTATLCVPPYVGSVSAWPNELAHERPLLVELQRRLDGDDDDDDESKMPSSSVPKATPSTARLTAVVYDIDAWSPEQKADIPIFRPPVAPPSTPKRGSLHSSPAKKRKKENTELRSDIKVGYRDYPFKCYAGCHAILDLLEEYGLGREDFLPYARSYAHASLAGPYLAALEKRRKRTMGTANDNVPLERVFAALGRVLGRPIWGEMDQSFLACWQAHEYYYHEPSRSALVKQSEVEVWRDRACPFCADFNCIVHAYARPPNAHALPYELPEDRRGRRPRDAATSCSTQCERLIDLVPSRAQQRDLAAALKSLAASLPPSPTVYCDLAPIFGLTCVELKAHVTYYAGRKPAAAKLKTSTAPSERGLANTAPTCNCAGDTCQEATCACSRSEKKCDRFCSCPPDCSQRWKGCNCQEGSARADRCRMHNDTDNASCPCVKARRECDPLVCRCCPHDETVREGAPACKNQNLLRVDEQAKQTLVCESRVCSGYGLFLTDAVNKNDFIDEYAGTVLDPLSIDMIVREYICELKSTSYIFNVIETSPTDANSCIDAEYCGSKTRFLNQADPLDEDSTLHHYNTYVKVLLVNGIYRIALFANYGLSRGQELLLSYGDQYCQDYLQSQT